MNQSHTQEIYSNSGKVEVKENMHVSFFSTTSNILYTIVMSLCLDPIQLQNRKKGFVTFSVSCSFFCFVELEIKLEVEMSCACEASSWLCKDYCNNLSQNHVPFFLLLFSIPLTHTHTHLYIYIYIQTLMFHCFPLQIDLKL